MIKNGAIRLQFSVYALNNTTRIIDNLKLKIEKFATRFSGSDSVIIFDVNPSSMIKYGNAIHRDTDIVFF